MRSRGLTFLLILFLGLGSSLRACGGPAWSLRSCHANQKTFQGAWEMWELDHGEQASFEALREPLLDEGYVYHDHSCSRGEYLEVGRYRIACSVHGAVSGPWEDRDQSVREQLRAMGVENPVILDRVGRTRILPLSRAEWLERNAGWFGLVSAWIGFPGFFLLAFS